MQGLKRAVLETPRLQRLGALSSLCQRDIGALQPLGCPADTELALFSRLFGCQPHTQCPAVAIDRAGSRFFGTSASAAAAGDGRDSRRPRTIGASSDEETEIEEDEEEEDEEPVDEEEEDEEPVDGEVALSAARAAAEAAAAQAMSAEQQPDSDQNSSEGRIPRILQGLDMSNRTKRKQVLEQIRKGKIDVFGEPQYLPDAVEAEKEMEDWLSFFRAKVVDVNRTSRGSPTGGIGRFTAMVVVGNSNGVIGLGVGKSDVMGEAIKKANNQAMKTLFFVPRYNNSTILHPIVSRYGKVKVIMYPRSTGAGCKASHLISSICQLVGIQDIGIKVHGTRNVRNLVKALIRGFESQYIDQEQEVIPNRAREEKVLKAMHTALKTGQPGKVIGL